MSEHVGEDMPVVEIGSPTPLGLGAAYRVALLLAAFLGLLGLLLPGMAPEFEVGRSAVDTVVEAGLRALLWSPLFWFFALVNDRRRIRWARLGGLGVQLPGRPRLGWEDVRELQVVWLHRRWGVLRRGSEAGAEYARILLVTADPLWIDRTAAKGGSWLDRAAQQVAEGTGPVLALPTASARRAREIVELAGRHGVRVRDQREAAREEAFRINRGALLAGLLPLAVAVAVVLVALLLGGRG